MPNRLHLCLACLACAALLAGCSTPVVWGGFLRYHPLTVEASAPEAMLMAVAEVVARERGFVRVERHGYHLVGYTEHEGGGRDRVEISVEEGRLLVSIRTELADGDQWIAESFVCEEYAWNRERDLARAVTARSAPRLASVANP